jgi:hypothetical protein
MMKLAAMRNVGAMMVVEILSRLAVSVTVKLKKYGHRRTA